MDIIDELTNIWLEQKQHRNIYLSFPGIEVIMFLRKHYHKLPFISLSSLSLLDVVEFQ